MVVATVGATVAETVSETVAETVREIPTDALGDTVGTVVVVGPVVEVTVDSGLGVSAAAAVLAGTGVIVVPSFGFNSPASTRQWFRHLWLLAFLPAFLSPSPLPSAWWWRCPLVSQ